MQTTIHDKATFTDLYKLDTTDVDKSVLQYIRNIAARYSVSYASKYVAMRYDKAAHSLYITDYCGEITITRIPLPRL